jgi:hypothetical protein
MSAIPTLNNLQQKQFLLRIMIFTLVTVMAWVGFGLLHSQTKTTLPPELSKLSTPLNPNLDATVIDKIERKRQITPAELQNFPIFVTKTDNTGRTTSGILGSDGQVQATTPQPEASPSPSPSLLPLTPQPSPGL